MKTVENDLKLDNNIYKAQANTNQRTHKPSHELLHQGLSDLYDDELFCRRES